MQSTIQIFMKPVVLTIAIASVVLGGVLQANFIHLALTTLIALTLIVSGLILGIRSAFVVDSGWPVTMTRYWKAWATLLPATTLAWGVGYGLHRWEQHRTLQYVATMVSILDDIHAQTGRYPDELPEHASVPRLLRWKFGYQGGETFRFVYQETMARDLDYEFTSELRRWRWTDTHLLLNPSAKRVDSPE